MKGRLPNLIVIGAMKAGTTSLHNYLGKHPDIFMSTPKEIHYYSDDGQLKWTKERYMSHFITSKKIAGTSPQSYSKCHNKYYQNIPERIYKDTPNVKLVYLLRNPIERYKSHILESYHCDPIVDIEYSKESGNYWKTSLYGTQLQQYLKYFSIDQIQVITIEELNENPLAVMNQLFDFLEISPLQDESLFQEVKNSAFTKGIPRVIKAHIFYRMGKKVSKAYTEKVAKKIATKFYSEQLKKPQLSEMESKRLQNIFREDLVLLSQLTKRDFSKWNI